MNGFLKNGLLVVGGVGLGSMVTQKAIVDTLHSKEIAMRQNWRECQEVLFENRKGADDVLDNLRWVISKYGHATLADFYDLAGVRALYEEGGDTMAEYPNNSHSAREKSTATAAGKTEKKLDKVVTGAAKTKKKSEARRFLNIFAPDDAENVKSSILSDVIVPGVKAAIADVTSIVLFGDTGRIGSRKSDGSRIAYQKYYDDRRDDRREYGRPRAAVGFEYDDIIFETRGDADLVLDQLESAIAKYEVASVADLYDLAGVTCRNYTANRYGWSDIQSAKVVRTSEGYVIRLPRAVQIN